MAEVSLSPALQAGRKAIDLGCTALNAGQTSDAIRWFERACRVAPNEPSTSYLLASALAGVDPARASALLNTLLTKHPSYRDAAVLQVALMHRRGHASEAVAALNTLLCRFAIPQDRQFYELAQAVCRNDGCAGWIGLTGNGYLVLAADNLTFRLGRRRLAAPLPKATRYDLPANWRHAGTLVASVPQGVLLGSRIDLTTVARVQGFVCLEAEAVLTGWAFCAADPDTPPIITVYTEDGSLVCTVTADNADVAPDNVDGTARVRGFRVKLPAIPAGPLHVRAQDGRALMGSPIDVAGEALACRAALACGMDPWRPLPVSLADLLPPPARQALQARQSVDVIIPLYRGAEFFIACLASLTDNLLPGMRIVAIDDAIAEPRLRRLAEAAAANGRITLLRHATNRGFPAAVNTGLHHAAGRDVVLLNSDTLLPPGALARLADAAYDGADIGTVTPMTTDGTLTSRHKDSAEPMPSCDRLAELDRACATANKGLRIAIPSCVGFCVFIRHDCLAETGLLRNDVFAQGYGEEIDFSLRASQLGWRHVAACDVLVAHAGNTSFGLTGHALRTRNQGILERLHPGFLAKVRAWITANSLEPARFAIDAALWETKRDAQSIILITHDRGGGVARHVSERALFFRQAGQRAIIVKPGNPSLGGFVLSDATTSYTHLHFHTAEALAVFLKADHPTVVELHHVADHDPTILRLAGLLRVPFDFFAHDYAPICPRITFCSGPAGYCGEPADRRDCEDCIADHGTAIPLDGSVEQHRSRQATILRMARRLITPSRDAAMRFGRYVAGLSPVVTPWEDDTVLTRNVQLPVLSAGSQMKVAIVGGIGHEKGFNIILACARDAQRRDLPLHFAVVGHTIDDSKLIATGRVFVTGRFSEGEAAAMLQDLAPDLGFLPSIWPETWCFALSTLWQAGLHVTAFDIGAPAERIKTAGPSVGTILPLNTQAAQINDSFVNLALLGRKPSPPLRRTSVRSRTF